MIVDTSAIREILYCEPDAGRHEGTIAKGNHPAGLNFGDCFAFAIAGATGEPLLFKGRDFARTDIAPALAPEADNSMG